MSTDRDADRPTARAIGVSTISLHGPRYWAQRTITRMTNVRFFHKLFGDSSYIVHYLRVLGYRFVQPIVQTGTDFGTELHHASPYLTTVGSGTMVSDAFLIMNVEG